MKKKTLKFPIKFLYIEYLIQLHTSQTKKVHKRKFKTDISTENLT